MHNKWTNSIVAVCLFSILCMMPVMAQDLGTNQDTNISYSDEALRSFIIANASINQLQQHADAQMQNMASDQQKQEMMEATNQQILQVLQQAGLTVDEYNVMGQTIQSDAHLQLKLQAITSGLFQQ
ncbi:MAG: DUF4168 domain-containing protein [Burkholderiales bacterium]|nr:DUF4168 domain-containing protein [Nitrosomonas sp.]MCP5274393.1 DUF4168 domain-containing protein [Burkholderiales bacterium]